MSACEVNHVVEGPAGAPALVLLNSLGADARMWDAQAAALRERFRLVRFDARGHGASPVPPGPYSLAGLGGDLLALLDRLGISRASLCGVSLGGATAIWVAANAPERVERLAVLFSSASFGDPGAWAARAALVRAEGSAAVADAVVGRWLSPSLLEGEPELAARLREMVAATPAEGYAASCEALAGIDLSDDLARVAAPTLVVSGSEDPALPPAHGRAIAAGIAGARFVELSGVAHLGNLERPEAVTALMLEHFAVTDREEREVPLSDHEEGMKVRREVLGDAHVDRAEAGKDEFTADFQEFITSVAWGQIWARPGLGRRERSIATLAALVALRAEGEIGMHVQAALRNGLTPEEIREVILHTSVYAGVPAANSAFGIAQKALYP